MSSSKLAIGGGRATMDREEAAEAVAIIRPKVVVPMHNWGSDLVEFAALVAHKTPGVQVAILEGQDLAL